MVPLTLGSPLGGSSWAEGGAPREFGRAAEIGSTGRMNMARARERKDARLHWREGQPSKGKDPPPQKVRRESWDRNQGKGGRPGAQARMAS